MRLIVVVLGIHYPKSTNLGVGYNVSLSEQLSHYNIHKYKKFHAGCSTIVVLLGILIGSIYHLPNLLISSVLTSIIYTIRNSCVF